MGIVWLDPMPTLCPVCRGQFQVPVAELRTLRAVCPGCGASLAVIGERMLAEEKRINLECHRISVAFELEEQTGLVVLDDGEFDSARPLGDVVRIVARLLNPAADREERATRLVTEAVRRVAPALLGELPSAVQPPSGWAEDAEPGALVPSRVSLRKADRNARAI